MKDTTPQEVPDTVRETPDFDDFAVPSYEEWYAQTVASLKGADFDKTLTTKTYEGFTLQPLYRQADIDGLSHPNTLPGQYPYVRGSRAEGYLAESWAVAQELPYPTAAELNEALLHDLAHGQTAVNLVLDAPSRAGLDPEVGLPVGRNGTSIGSLADLEAALAGVDLAQTPIYIQVGSAGLPFSAFLAALAARRNVAVNQLSGWIAFDPLGQLAETGTLPAATVAFYNEMAQVTAWAAEHAPGLATIAIHTTPYHNGGAHTVQELACAIATGIAYVRELLDRNLDVATIAAKIRFSLDIGGDFFMEVAKLRAARMLWAQVLTAFGASEADSMMHIHARTGRYNKTAYDPYVNMLRTTTEAMAGAVGGADSLHVSPFDSVLRQPDAFSRRIARNQQLVLQGEVSLARLIDPTGGSWYVEYLTNQLAQSAWALVQEIEAQGGMEAALKSGFIQGAIASTAAERAANLGKRKNKLVGTNAYPNVTETPLPADNVDFTAIARSRSEQIRAQRADVSGKSITSFEDVIQLAETGASLGQITAAARTAGDGITIKPIESGRLAQPFEALRSNAARYVTKHGHAPRIFLANMGPLSQHKARADFSQEFFAVGGFEILSSQGFETPEAAARAAAESGTNAIVMCSTDSTYPDIVRPFVNAVKSHQPDAVIILAGYPADQVEAHREAGVDAFIHVRADCFAVNQWLQDNLNITG